MKRILVWLLLLPLQILAVLLLAVTEVVRLVAAPFRRRPAVPPPAETGLCTIVMLNWNGRHLLEESVPPLLQAVRHAGGGHQVLVVDNGSSDDSVAWLRHHHPEVDILELPENLGFSEGNNRGVEAAKHEIVVLLNNDMIVAVDFLPPLLGGFAEPDVFAVTSQVDFPAGKRREETGNGQGCFRLGHLHLSHDPIEEYHYRRRYLPVLWAGGGSSAFRRSLFLQLGGFARRFSPCYVEDTDLSFRAWRRGWRVVLAAESRVLHKHRSSSGVRFSPKQIEHLFEVRRYWYIWRNYELRTLLPHLLLTPLNFWKWVPPGAYFRALAAILPIMIDRLREPPRVFRDREILGWTQRPILYLNRWQPDRIADSRTAGGRLRILIASAYLPHLGTHGGAGRVFQLLKRVARTHQVDLVTFVEDDRDASFAGQLEGICRRVELVNRTGYRPLSWFAYEPFEEFNVPEFRRALEKMLCTEDYDVVHFEWTQMALYMDAVPPQTRTAITEIEVNYAAHQTLENVEPRFWRRFKLKYNTLQTLFREVELCRRVDRVVCVTGEDRDYLRNYLPEEKLEVINTGVDIHYFSFQEEGSEEDTLVFVGAFRHSPNLDAMRYFCREVFPRIKTERPQARLYIVGSSPPEEIVEMGRQPGIEVTGFVEDIRDYYRMARVVVVPLRTGVGIRGKILEGWAVGRATVATPLACQGLRVYHGENILVADNAEEFARWILALLGSPAHCSRLGSAGRKMAENYYDWDVLGEQMTRFYEDLVLPEGAGLRATA